VYLSCVGSLCHISIHYLHLCNIDHYRLIFNIDYNHCWLFYFSVQSLLSPEVALKQFLNLPQHEETMYKSESSENPLHKPQNSHINWSERTKKNSRCCVIMIKPAIYGHTQWAWKACSAHSTGWCLECLATCKYFINHCEPLPYSSMARWSYCCWWSCNIYHKMRRIPKKRMPHIRFD